jgi:hypothetical protein
MGRAQQEHDIEVTQRKERSSMLPQARQKPVIKGQILSQIASDYVSKSEAICLGYLLGNVPRDRC